MLIATAPVLEAEQYAAFAGAIQAVIVVAAFYMAVVTYRGDSRNKRVDRVYDLHRELTTGEVNDARRRLTRHLREHHPRDRDVLRVGRLELREASTLNIYADGMDAVASTPWRDVNLLLRFFERARLVQLAGSADDPVFVELIGRHAGWWNCALKLDTSNHRKSLMALGVWADEFATVAANKARYSYLAGWGNSRVADFGSLCPWLDDQKTDADKAEAT